MVVFTSSPRVRVIGSDISHKAPMNRCIRSLPLVTVSLVGLEFLFTAASVRADGACFQAGSCLSFVGSVPGQCLADQDDKMTVEEDTGNVVVLSTYGSRVAVDTDLLSSVSEDDNWYNWHRYDLRSWLGNTG